MQPIYRNIGPFWKKHPDVYKSVTRFTDTDQKGNIIEAWERDENGVMVDVTARERARQELIRAQEACDKLGLGEEDYDDM